MADDSSARTITFVRRPSILCTIVDDELIIMAEGENAFFVSNAVGSMLWESLEAPTTIDALCDAVMERFDGAARADVLSDVMEFIAALEQRDLVISGSNR